MLKMLPVDHVAVAGSASALFARLGAENDLPHCPRMRSRSNGFHVRPNFGLNVSPKSL